MTVLEAEIARRRRRATARTVKTYPVLELKALADGPAGRFEAIVAVFNNIDAYGDRILPGAFERTLKPPPEGRGFPPIVWSHMWFEPPIGASLEAEEVDKGLRILGQLNLDDNARAREVYAAMKNVGGDGLAALREFSFAYFVRESRLIEEPIDPEDSNSATREVLELLDLEVIEVGPTLLGANPDTELLDVASGLADGDDHSELATALAKAALAVAEVKAGAVLSAANRGRIESAIEALTEVLADASKEDDGKGLDTEATQERRREVAELLSTFP